MRNVNFNFLNFCTRYKVDGTQYKAMRTESCFSDVFSGPRHQANDYTIEIFFEKYRDNDNNNCWLTTEQLTEYIEEVRKLIHFEYTLKKNENKYILKFKLNAPLLYHKFVLSWIRYAYEFPYNMIVEECFKLKETKGFKRINFFNLFNIVGPSLNYECHGTTIHAIGVLHEFKELVTYKTLIKTLKKLDARERVNNILEVVDGKVKKDVQYIKTPRNLSIENSNYWDDNKEFKKRIKVYKNNYKILKEIK